MSARIVLLTAVGLLLAGFGPATTAGDKDKKEDAVKQDLKLLEGDWVLDTFETNGKPVAADKIKNIKLTIAGDRYMVDFGGKPLELSFKIDPSQKPKAMDLIVTKDDKKVVTPGIYEVSTDTFRLCRPTEAGKERPTTFATKEGSGLALATYKRAKK
jgi:uncharacterized protein (TIGR03067 family)